LIAFTENLQFCTYLVHACNPSDGKLGITIKQRIHRDLQKINPATPFLPNSAIQLLRQKHN